MDKIQNIGCLWGNGSEDLLGRLRKALPGLMVRLSLDGGLANAVVCFCPNSENVLVRFVHFAVCQFYLKRRRLKADIKPQLMMCTLKYLEATALMSAIYLKCI